MILLGHAESDNTSSLTLEAERAVERQILGSKEVSALGGLSAALVSRSGIDLAPWHDRHLRSIFHRLFSCTGNPIATERRTLCFLVGLALTSLMVTELSRFTTFAIGHCFCMRVHRVSLIADVSMTHGNFRWSLIFIKNLTISKGDRAFPPEVLENVGRRAFSAVRRHHANVIAAVLTERPGKSG